MAANQSVCGSAYHFIDPAGLPEACVGLAKLSAAAWTQLPIRCVIATFLNIDICNLRNFSKPVSLMSKQLSSDSIFGAIPPGVNPFDYLHNVITPQFLVPFSRLTTAILAIFFIFHLLIAIFCLALLVLPYLRGIEQYQWLFKRVYIRNYSGQNLYNTPLLLVNTGMIMAISQFMGSIAAQAFILVLFKASHSTKYALNSPLASPFPIGVIAATIALFAWLSSGATQFVAGAVKVLDTLGRGSSVWDQLKVTSTSGEEKFLLTSQLLQVVSDAKNFSDDVSIRLENLITCFRVVQCVLLIIILITSLVFVSLFWGLVRKLMEDQRQSDRASSQPNLLRHEDERTNSWGKSAEQSGSRKLELINIFNSDRQFLYLAVRATSIILAMMTTITLLLVGIIRTSDVPSLAGSFDLADDCCWQHWVYTLQLMWRLYQEQLGRTPKTLSNPNYADVIGVSARKSRDPSRPAHHGAETLELQVEPNPNASSLTNRYEEA
ncbi:hypothetical protein PGT21_016533 [Puccinia graminis f. sp. tritici]|uniref:Uncharacterized protein n=1 Tax=Puccinia graminis f. sp. tritici TaxID=56615 RepID=A0A5B0MF03_PUCGR|nr:hypothetical protein PGT21_016533 [Puccinia graminis f. sp. tritici]